MEQFYFAQHSVQHFLFNLGRRLSHHHDIARPLTGPTLLSTELESSKKFNLSFCYRDYHCKIPRIPNIKIITTEVYNIQGDWKLHEEETKVLKHQQGTIGDLLRCEECERCPSETNFVLMFLGERFHQFDEVEFRFWIDYIAILWSRKFWRSSKVSGISARGVYFRLESFRPGGGKFSFFRS